jgi:hypothetical protein
MNNLTYNLLEGIRNYLHQTHCDLISFRRMPDQEEYVVRIKPRSDAGDRMQKLKPEGIYLSNGKLNIPFLMKNADLLFDAGDYSSARKIYKSILQSGECSASLLSRLEKCNEAEGVVSVLGIKREKKVQLVAAK